VQTGVGRTALGRFVLRVANALAEIEVFDRSMTLAAQAFTSLLPLIIVAAAIRHGDTRPIGQGMSQYLGLNNSATQVIERSIPDASEMLSALGWFGAVLLLASATAFSRALDRFYARVWSIRRPGLRGAWRWVAVLAAILIGVALVQFTRSIMRSDGGYIVLTFILESALWTLIWLAAGWIILNRAIRVRSLLPGAMLCGIGLALTGGFGRIYLPIALTSAAQQFGALGITIAYIGWLFILMFIVVVGVTVGHVLTKDYGLFGGVQLANRHVDDRPPRG
jgi:membrane protein